MKRRVIRSLSLKENIILFVLDLDMERDPFKVSIMKIITKDSVLGENLTIPDMV